MAMTEEKKTPQPVSVCHWSDTECRSWVSVRITGREVTISLQYHTLCLSKSEQLFGVGLCASDAPLPAHAERE